MSQDISQVFTKEDIKIASQPLKRCSQNNVNPKDHVWTSFYTWVNLNLFKLSYGKREDYQ
jgi:hypothetical protein